MHCARLAFHVVAILNLFACGGMEDNGHAANSNGGSASVGGNGAVAGGTMIATGGFGTGGTTTPSECQVASNGSVKLPQTITFKWVNHQASTLYVSLPGACTAAIDIYSCADGYQSAFAHEASCMASCSNSGCVQCGMCAPDPTTIAPGATLTSQWGGQVFTFGTNTSGCPCYNDATAATGKYRAVLAEYVPALSTLGTYMQIATVSVDFNYPDDDGIVTVDL